MKGSGFAPLESARPITGNKKTPKKVGTIKDNPVSVGVKPFIR